MTTSHRRVAATDRVPTRGSGRAEAPTIQETCLRRIQHALPAADPRRFEAFTEDAVNDVVMVDCTWAYRFAKHA